ncbi:dihydrolipoamide acetyltransferase family protein [Leucobacter celer]|jgi:pyruvate dehydrogenase E2 component (dihydrolipoamide acetyltransferase)|uniref:dihydrolipoamide acetyltransferase family protein n=1 Tax=Leucobacter celer TaxID=668625 RepID=UPI0006A793F9|nr:dihydrolipoamide acetyltransferase family protein [Leucobacter celer]
MSTVFLLPDLGEGLVEARVVQWFVEAGDAVALNQPLAEMETAKAIVEIPSPHAGIAARLHAQVGDTVEVGSPLISFEVEGADDGAVGTGPEGSSPRAADSGDGTADGTADAAPEPTLVGYGAAATTSVRPARRRRIRSAAPAPAHAPAGEPERRRRPRATPPVRVYARRSGVDLAAIADSVGDRLITRDDVDRHVGAGAPPRSDHEDSTPSTATAQPDGTIRIPVTGVRKHTAEAMVQSAFTAPQATVFYTVDATGSTEFISSLGADRTVSEHRIGLLAVVARAVCLALREVPEVNARWDGDAGEILQFDSVDLGIAAATDRGLLLPNIHGADRLSLTELADELRDLTAAARSGKTTPQSLAGGTFSITNVGVFGVDTGTPILPPGQAGILAVGAVRRRPWEHRGGIELRDVLTLSLSFDHRVIDGAESSRFLKIVGDLLESPARAMLLA